MGVSHRVCVCVPGIASPLFFFFYVRVLVHLKAQNDTYKYNAMIAMCELKQNDESTNHDKVNT